MPGDGMAAWDESDRQGAGRSPEQLRRIIRYQRWLIAVVLGQLALWIGSIALTVIKRRADFDDGMNFPVLLTFILGCVGGIFVFLTAWELRPGDGDPVHGATHHRAGERLRDDGVEEAQHQGRPVRRQPCGRGRPPLALRRRRRPRLVTASDGPVSLSPAG